MLSHPPTLNQQIAGLRSAISADQAPAWLPDALHALIIAILARLLGRLEAMIQLWQSGQLPPPPLRAPARHTTPRRQTRSHAPRPHASESPRRAIAPPGAPMPASRAPAITRAASRTPPIPTPHRGFAAPPPPHPARAPPVSQHPISP
ncbi:MAG: hypothetical protein IT555_10365 [Acetobacteraceae bacterium]|nr:hypothetical protein [Acetobacteraceae bacterium]